MKEDAWLIAAVFIVWAVLSTLYFTIPMIHMPTTGRVWGLGGVLFLILALLVVWANSSGKRRRNINIEES